MRMDYRNTQKASIDTLVVSHNDNISFLYIANEKTYLEFQQRLINASKTHLRGLVKDN